MLYIGIFLVHKRILNSFKMTARLYPMMFWSFFWKIIKNICSGLIKFSKIISECEIAFVIKWYFFEFFYKCTVLEFKRFFDYILHFYFWILLIFE